MINKVAHVRLFVLKIGVIGNQVSKNSTVKYGKGSKIKLIFFAEFSANGGGVPPIRENNYFFQMLKNVQNALKHEKN